MVPITRCSPRCWRLVTFNDQVLLSNIGSSINTGATAGNIVFASTVDGTQSLDLTAGVGTITFQGLVGDTSELGAVTVNSAFDVTADLAFTAESFRQVAGSGTTTFSGALSTSAAAGVNVDGTNFDFNDTVTVALGDIDVDATGTVRFNGAVSNR